MDIVFSIIVPVYNRPDEIQELLESFLLQTYQQFYEIVIVEDGSTYSAEAVVLSFSDRLTISYLKKENSGPGDSRNYGMKRAKGSYFIILDSDCILPPTYLATVALSLQEDYVDCFGGPDIAHPSFTAVQKAINFAMTSFLTTGGIRGKKSSVTKFQPRSFNMGISKNAFLKTGGFGNIHPGEDPDLTLRIWQAGYATKLLLNAAVYHKRRINWSKFYTQVNKFGMVRPILNKWHPGSGKITYWFPTIFSLGFILAIVLLVWDKPFFIWIYCSYFILVLLVSFIENKNFIVGLYSVFAVCIQFLGYGYGFLKSTIKINWSKKSPQELFPKLFFKPQSIV